MISVLSTLSNTECFLPVFGLASPLRLDLELANASTALACGGTTPPTSASYTISSVSLDCEYVWLAEDSHRAICGLTNNVFQWTSSMWKTYRTVHAAGQLSNTILIPSRVTSMINLLIAQREAATEYNVAARSVTQRLRNGLKSSQVRCGSAGLLQPLFQPSARLCRRTSRP